MTKAQERAYEELKKEFLGFYGHPENKEFKNDEVKENWYNDMIYINLTVGYIDDEETMASIFCRNDLTIAISKNGTYYAFRPTSHKMFSCGRSTITACIRGQEKDGRRKN
jgi:hypothetical protein